MLNLLKGKLQLVAIISLSTSKRLKFGDVILCFLVLIAALLFVPKHFFSRMNIGWFSSLFIFPLTFIAGLLSSEFHYRRYKSYLDNPFYIRAWWSLLSGLIAFPACLVFRFSVAHLALAVFSFGAGPVFASHVSRRFTKQI